MMKQLSFLIITGALAVSSCSTKRFQDVVPETAGTELGEVPIGRENSDYFIIPERDASGIPQDRAAAVVVFKTADQHPTRRAAHLAGTPVRTVNRVGSTLVGGVTDFATTLVTEPFQAREEELDHPARRTAARDEFVATPATPGETVAAASAVRAVPAVPTIPTVPTVPAVADRRASIVVREHQRYGNAHWHNLHLSPFLNPF